MTERYGPAICAAAPAAPNDSTKPLRDQPTATAPTGIPATPQISRSVQRQAPVRAAAATQTIRRLRGQLETLQKSEAVQRARIEELEAELRLAASLQRNLRSETPRVDRATIHTLCCSADVVSGDMVDVVRVNDSEIAITLLDATGHGLAAGILAAYVKRSLGGANLTHDADMMQPPNAVLADLNKHLLDIKLEDCHFVTATYVVYNEKTRVIRWARAGAPYPVLVRPGKQPLELVSSGPLLGVLPDAEYEVVELRLKPGETFVVYTDGLDGLISENRRQREPGSLSPAGLLYQHQAGGFAEFWSEFSGFVNSCARNPDRRDDMTVVALHVEEHEPADINSAAGEPVATPACVTDSP